MAKELYFICDGKIVYHDYLGSGGTDYNLNASWGNEVVVLAAGAESRKITVDRLAEQK